VPFTADEKSRVFAAEARFRERPHFGGLWALHSEAAMAFGHRMKRGQKAALAPSTECARGHLHRTFLAHREAFFGTAPSGQGRAVVWARRSGPYPCLTAWLLDGLAADGLTA
jgi:hypothetical protein